jgi:HicB family
MKPKAHQYTIRNVSPRLDRALRVKAAERGVSLNRLVVQALEAEAGVGAGSRAYHDLDDLFGTWVPDEAVDRALADQRQVDLKDWA